MQPVKPRGTRRQVQAAATRAAILAAARRLYAERGYSATTVADIVAEAGVALQTFYDSVGSKRGALLALLEVMDEEAEVGALAARIAAEREPRQVILLVVRLTRQLNERCEDLVRAIRSAAPVEPEVAEAFGEGMARHRAGAALAMEQLGRHGRLRPGLSAERATAILATFTAPAIYARLVEEYGWTFDECEEFLGQTLTGLILRADA